MARRSQALAPRPVTPYLLARAFGYQEDDPAFAAAALRTAWFWLDREEIETRVAQLCFADAEYAVAEHPDRDWNLAFGAIWDVCSVEQAEQLFRPFKPHLEAAKSWRMPQSLYTAAIQLASRLPRRDLAYSASRTVRVAYGYGMHPPATRAQFRAEASLPEWHQPISDLILKDLENHYKVDALAAVADSLPGELLEQQLAATQNVSGDVRDMVLGPILATLATRSVNGAKRALRAISGSGSVIHQGCIGATR